MLRRAIWMLAFIAAASLSPSRAQDFYRDRTVTVVIGLSAGGYDLYGRAPS